MRNLLKCLFASFVVFTGCKEREVVKEPEVARHLGLIIVAFHGKEICYFMHENVIARNDNELVSYLLANDFDAVKIESKIKLAGNREERLIHCMNQAGIELQSFIVPTSCDVDQVDLMQCR